MKIESSDPSMTDQERIRKLRPIPAARYRDIDLNHLIMYAVAQLEAMGADLSFENVVVASFRLFPKKFSLLGFPSYPDAKRVHDSLFRCTFRDRQWLGGQTRQGFFITDRSRVIMKDAEDLLSGVLVKKRPALSTTRRKEAVLSELLSSATYEKYKLGKTGAISDGEFCFLLQATLDSSAETLRENLLALQRFAAELCQQDIGDFLSWLERRFSRLLKDK